MGNGRWLTIAAGLFISIIIVMAATYSHGYNVPEGWIPDPQYFDVWRSPAVTAELHKIQRALNSARQVYPDAGFRVNVFISSDGFWVEGLIGERVETVAGYVLQWRVLTVFGTPTVQRYLRDNVCKVWDSITLDQLEYFFHRKDV